MSTISAATERKSRLQLSSTKIASSEKFRHNHKDKQNARNPLSTELRHEKEVDFPEFLIVRETNPRYAAVHGSVRYSARLACAVRINDRWLPHHDTGRVPHLSLDLEQVLVDWIDRQPFATSLQRLPAGKGRGEAGTWEKNEEARLQSTESRTERKAINRGSPVVTEGGFIPPAA